MTTYQGNWPYTQPQKNAREALEEVWKPLCLLENGLPKSRRQIKRMVDFANERLEEINNTKNKMPALNQSLMFIPWSPTIYLSDSPNEFQLDELLNELVVVYTRKIKEI